MKNQIIKTAHELTIKFQDESDIPSRFKKPLTSARTRNNPSSKIENNYQKHIKEWTEAINSILSNVSDTEQAWRFIRIKPKVDDATISSVTQCDDFNRFTDLLIQRRDINICSDNELGKLCMLIGAFQKEIEKVINS